LSASCCQRSVEIRVDGKDGVGAGYLEDLEDAFGGSDEAELAAVGFHLAEEDHEETEAGAVEEFDAGELEDELANAVAGDFGDPGFDLAQAHAEGHASSEAEDGGSCVGAVQLNFEDHVVGVS
jgi:hypothetical protein